MMNTQSMSDSRVTPQVMAPAAVSWSQSFYWSVRRELWENRSIYLAPLTVAGLFLIGFTINLIRLRQKFQSTLAAAEQHPHDLLTTRYELAAALIMGTALIVGIFYSLDALYGERRDRSILFWKSLPISDLTAVLSKVAVPLVILPLVSFVITITTQFFMLLISTVVLAGSGVNMGNLWTEASFFKVSLIILYHLLTVHGLWYAPLYGWFFMVSAWASRAPFIWAFLPPFVISMVEKITFGTPHFASFLLSRLAGPPAPVSMAPGVHMDIMAELIPVNFFSQPGLWTGLLVAAIFVAIAIRLRRYRGPI